MQPTISDAVVIGVDTHKDVHVAVALSGLGSRLGGNGGAKVDHGSGVMVALRAA